MGISGVKTEVYPWYNSEDDKFESSKNFQTTASVPQAARDATMSRSQKLAALGQKNERAQIDMVIERADKITNLCEIKYTNKPFEIDASYEQQLIRKRDVFRKKTGTSHALKIIMISAKGLSGTAYTSYISDTITLDDLFD